MAATLHLPGVVLRGAENGARHENGAVNNNAIFAAHNNADTMLVSDYNGCCFNGSPVARGFLLKPPSLYDFPVRVNRNSDLSLSFSLSLSPIERSTKRIRLTACNVKISKREPAK